MDAHKRAATQQRARAARILVGIIHQQKTLDQSFGQDDVSPLLRELVTGTLRHYYSLNDELEQYLVRELRAKDLDLRCLLLVGAYQLRHLRIPAHAVIHETVGACRALRKPWARGLLNGVLRNLDRAAPVDAERTVELPDWISQRIRHRYPHADAVIAAQVARAPLSLRINVSRISPAEYGADLARAGLDFHTGHHPENLILDHPVPVRELPGHADGLVSIQDPGAMFAAPLLADSADGRILDACAAPGGKLCHLAERLPGAQLVGLELKPARLQHLGKELQRLGHDQGRVECVGGDATELDWYSGIPFDGILLDAPCSGSGTLRRHPDIKLLRRESDLAGYATTQQAMLVNLWQTLKPGGSLLYCTCSLFEEENDAVIQKVLSMLPDARLDPVQLSLGMPTSHGWQLFPLPFETDADQSVDGFYFARMTRMSRR